MFTVLCWPFFHESVVYRFTIISAIEQVEHVCSYVLENCIVYDAFSSRHIIALYYRIYLRWPETQVNNQCMDERNINDKWKGNVQNNSKKKSYIPVIKTKVLDDINGSPSAIQPIMGILIAPVFHQRHWNKCGDFKSVPKTGILKLYEFMNIKLICGLCIKWILMLEFLDYENQWFIL